MTTHRTDSSARGAIIIHVAIAILALIAFSAFVVDYGIMWVARSQAQAAADAGAHAGAVTLTRGGTIDDAFVAAKVWAGRVPIWGQLTAPADIIVANVTCPDLNKPCIRVDVLRGIIDRDGAPHGNTIPTFFAPLVGVTSQGVRATATAESAAGNATNCLKPWLIPDRWQENTAPATTFNGADVYIAPTTSSPGTGWTTANIGQQLVLKEGDPHDAIDSSDYDEIGDGNTYDEAITGCIINAALGDTVSTLPGNRKGPTKSAVKDLIDSDPGYWDPSTKTVINSNGNRIVPIGLFSPAEYSTLDRTTGNFNLTITNILGFWVDSVDNQGSVTGYIVSDPGLFVDGKGTVGPNSAFVKVTRLVQ